MARYQITSHENFTHDSLDSFGYDWERIGDPSIQPRRPLKIYLPQTTEELIAVIQDANRLGEKLTIRSQGHSSNDLVLSERGAVLGMQMMAGIVWLDRENLWVKVLAGTMLAELDEALRQDGLGLKVIGDHNHITAGGFASVGGISPASHRFGLFLDTVEAAEVVNWDGELTTYSRSTNPEALRRVLGATGRAGVIATLTLALYRVEKWTTVLCNDRFVTRDLHGFIEHSWKKISNPGDVVMERGVWLEYPLGKRLLRIGQFSAYRETRQTRWARLSDRLNYGYLHFLGRWAGRLPAWLDTVLKLLGTIGIVFSPRYATIKNVETFTDRVLDSSVGDPTRMLIVLAPMEHYKAMFLALDRLLDEYRKKYRCFTFTSLYVKAINSPWLSGGAERPYCELMLYLGCRPEALTPERLSELVASVDEMCVEHEAYRYMHTKTSKDPAILSKVDPHAQYIREQPALAAE